MSDRRLGIPARIRFDYAPSGRGLEPRRVEHLQFGITWDVTAILGRWAHPGRAEDTIGEGDPPQMVAAESLRAAARPP